VARNAGTPRSFARTGSAGYSCTAGSARLRVGWIQNNPVPLWPTRAAVLAPAASLSASSNPISERHVQAMQRVSSNGSRQSEKKVLRGLMVGAIVVDPIISYKSHWQGENDINKIITGIHPHSTKRIGRHKKYRTASTADSQKRPSSSTRTM
jgi:hypothetical protein